MAKGMSIHVGVNDTKAAGVSAPLEGCDNDAKKMFELADDRGFIGVNGGKPDLLLGDDATHDAVLGKMRIAAEELEAGDIFLFTFSGHGTRRGQEDPEEKDLKDETLVMQDSFLVDNVLRRLIWPQFKAGVRVVMVSDSCHGGGAAMSLLRDSEGESTESSNGGSSVATTRNGSDSTPAADFQAINVRSRGQGDFRIRTISEIEAQTHFELLKEFYDQLRSTLPKDPPPVKAEVLLLAACRETERTKDGVPNGLFTTELLKVFNSNGSKTYKQLMAEIGANLEAANEASHPVMMSIPDLPVFSETEAFRI